MSERVDAFPVSVRLTQGMWDQWLDGAIWKLTEGLDYRRFTSLRTMAYAQASRRNKRVEVRKGNGYCYLKATPK
jgi:hypothetical protein